MSKQTKNNAEEALVKGVLEEKFGKERSEAIFGNMVLEKSEIDKQSGIDQYLKVADEPEFAGILTTFNDKISERIKEYVDDCRRGRERLSVQIECLLAGDRRRT